MKGNLSAFGGLAAYHEANANWNLWFSIPDSLFRLSDHVILIFPHSQCDLLCTAPGVNHKASCPSKRKSYDEY